MKRTSCAGAADSDDCWDSTCVDADEADPDCTEDCPEVCPEMPVVTTTDLEDM